jgi:hypothetical protein
MGRHPRVLCFVEKGLRKMPQNVVNATTFTHPITLDQVKNVIHTRRFTKHFFALLDHPVFRGGRDKKVFNCAGQSILLVVASYIVTNKEGYFYQDYSSQLGYHLQKGQCAIRLRFIAKRLGISDHKLISRWLKRLEEFGILKLTTVRTGKDYKLFTVITFLLPFVNEIASYPGPIVEAQPIPENLKTAKTRYIQNKLKSQQYLSSKKEEQIELSLNTQIKCVTPNENTTHSNLSSTDKSQQTIKEKIEYSLYNNDTKEEKHSTQNNNNNTNFKIESHDNKINFTQSQNSSCKTNVNYNNEDRSCIHKLPKKMKPIVQNWISLNLNTATFQGYYQKCTVEAVNTAIQLHGFDNIMRSLSRYHNKIKEEQKSMRYCVSFKNFFLHGYYKEHLLPNEPNKSIFFRKELLHALGGKNFRTAINDIHIKEIDLNDRPTIIPGSTFREVVLNNEKIAKNIALISAKYSIKWTCYHFQSEIFRIQHIISEEFYK